MMYSSQHIAAVYGSARINKLQWRYHHHKASALSLALSNSPDSQLPGAHSEALLVLTRACCVLFPCREKLDSVLDTLCWRWANLTHTGGAR